MKFFELNIKFYVFVPNLDLVSMPEIEGIFHGFVLKPEIECQKFYARLDVRD